MGTEYKVIERGLASLRVGEMSNAFELVAVDLITNDTVIADQLTVEQLANVAFEILKVASYWHDPDAFAAWCEKRLTETLDYSSDPSPLVTNAL